MRLTLRTLLAYLDDTLEPSQAKLIGQKVAESDTAQELIARIKQVTRRRRLTTPPDKGPGGKVDANTIAEYLDNTLNSDQLADVEQLCLASDVHLAEIAACHQILTLVLGEPALVPPTAKQRMYGLVKGRESIHFRKPTSPKRQDADELPPESREVDETLRLGLPLPGKDKVSNRLIMIGGGCLLVLFLGIALWQMLASVHHTDTDLNPPDQQQQAKVEPKVKPNVTDKVGKDGNAAEKDKTGKDKKDPAETKKPVEIKTNPPDDKKNKPKKPPVDEEDNQPEKSILPSDVVREVGVYDAPKATTASVLVEYDPKEQTWQRLAGEAAVSSGKPLVSLPGYRSDINLKSGARLSLWGNYLPQSWKDHLMPQLKYEASAQERLAEEPGNPLPPFPWPPLLESMVVIHTNKQFDLDVTLKRGRILVSNTRKEPLKLRLRFDNPTDPKLGGIWDVTLPTQGCQIALERWSFFPPGEGFVMDRKSATRGGPVAHVDFYVLRGEAQVKIGDAAPKTLDEPPGFSRLVWNSRQGVTTRLKPQKLEQPPAWVNAPPPATPKLDAETAELLKEAARSLAADLKGDQIDVGLKNALDAKPIKRAFAVRGLTALDDDSNLGRLIDALEDEKNFIVRISTIDALRYWITLERENDYRLYDLLDKRYRKAGEKKSGEAAIIMGLLHDYPMNARYKKDTYEALIDYLASKRLAVRELAYWRLLDYYPEGAKLTYTPVADPDQRRQGIQRWRALLEEDRLPPMPPKGGKEKQQS